MSRPPLPASDGKGLSNKAIPTAQTTTGGVVRTGLAPTSSIPHHPPAIVGAPTGPSASKGDVPPPADRRTLEVPPAAKNGVPAPAAGRAEKHPAPTKVVTAANALKAQLKLLASRKALQQPPIVDAGVAKATGPSGSPTVVVASSSAAASRVVLGVADRTPSDPKSVLLRAQLGAHSAAAPTRPQRALATGTTKPSKEGIVSVPTLVTADVDGAAEKGVRAALATAGTAVDMETDADIAAIQTHLDAAKRTEHPPALAISDTAHVEPLATPSGGSAVPSTTTGGVGKGNPVLLDELTGLEETTMEEWKKVWDEVTASAARKAGETGEKTELAAKALAASACAVWYFVETGASVLGAAGKGKAAAMVAGASEKTADVFKEVMEAVLDVKIKREPAACEVALNVAPALQSHTLARAYPGGDGGVEADVIDRATVETTAF
ncbi:unnamed protein product [Closterium sp. Naga37s-1]|nr:unnamed protein product [Closterium sp. Naga37s-1]